MACRYSYTLVDVDAEWCDVQYRHDSQRV